MKNFFVFIVLAFSIISYAAPFDTGFITFTQPNGVEFTARKWGDEYNNMFETIEGYGVIQGNGGWYYYATVSENGEFTSSGKLVGIDHTIGIELHPQRSADRISYWENEEALVNAQRVQRYNEYIDGTNPISNLTSIKLGVVLIDFPTPEREGWYKDFYDSMLFSEGTYYGTRSGDLDPIFGSLNDYVIDQTNNNHNLVGRNGQPVIINDADPSDPNFADWMILQYEREYYNALPDQSVFINTIIQEVEAEYGINELKSYNVIGLIFAGNNTSGYFGATARVARLSDGTDVFTFRVPEFDATNVVHIGLIAHEFSHQAFGLQDEYKGIIDPGHHCLMAHGDSNGPPGAFGSCPAPINLGYKVDLGWVIPEIITKGTFDKTLYFDTIYKVEMYGETDQYFLLNMYEDEGFYEYTPSEIYAEEFGLSIWHWHKTIRWYDWAEVELASSSPSHYKFPADKNGLQSFNDYSTVNSRKRDGTLSDVAINDIDVNIIFGESPPTFEVILDVIDPVPLTPTNFTRLFYNNHPKFTWSLNNEPDIVGYEIYRLITGGSGVYELITTVSSSTSSFVDTEIELGGPTAGKVFYKIRAKDYYPNYSAYTNVIIYAYSGLNKLSFINNSVEYELFSNYPNPFNPSTQIRYSLAQDAIVGLKVYDMLGTEVAELINETQAAGSYEINFSAIGGSASGGNASNLSSGVYIYRITAANNGRILFTDSKQMILMK